MSFKVEFESETLSTALSQDSEQSSVSSEVTLAFWGFGEGGEAVQIANGKSFLKQEREKEAIL